MLYLTLTSHVTSITFQYLNLLLAKSQVMTPVKKRGTFATQSYTLKKTKRRRQYGCKLCTKVLDSTHLLTIHHQNKHSILYCKECNKAFNNPISLVCHQYQHRELKYPCACGASFPFSSQLQTHSSCTPPTCFPSLCVSEL